MNKKLNVQEHKIIAEQLREVKVATLFLFAHRAHPIGDLICQLEEKLFEEHPRPYEDNSHLKIYYGASKEYKTDTYPSEERQKELSVILRNAQHLLNSRYSTPKFESFISRKIEDAILTITKWPDKIKWVPKAA